MTNDAMRREVAVVAFSNNYLFNNRTFYVFAQNQQQC